MRSGGREHPSPSCSEPADTATYQKALLAKGAGIECMPQARHVASLIGRSASWGLLDDISRTL